MDLLKTNILENTAADAGWENLSPGIRAVWTTPIDGEDDAPQLRIIHCRLMRTHAPARLQRIGIRAAQGYHKCGSRVQIEWARAFRLLLWDGHQWIVHRYEKDLPRPNDGTPLWFDLGGALASAAIVEVRRCEIDPWWTPWNFAKDAFTLEGEMEVPPYLRRETRLTTEGIDFSGLPPGVTAERRPGEARFRTPFFEVGFWLGRAGFSFLALDEEGEGHTDRNLLRQSPTVFLQGIRYHQVGAPPVVAPLWRNDVTGSVNVQGNTVTYNVTLNEAGQQLLLEWKVLKESLVFRLKRIGTRPVRVWESSAWNIVCNSEVTPTAVLGDTIRHGETGAMKFPVLFHAPGQGTLQLLHSSGDGLCRSDSFRPLTFTSLELKVGELPQPEGDYLLPAGEYECKGEMVPYRTSVRLQPGTPISVTRSLQRCSITSMTFRADTGTLSNNGNSMHAPLCMDNWSSVAARIGDLSPWLPAVTLVRDSLERWLDGGPGYGSGGMAGGGEVHLAEDEYIMTGTAGLLGLAEYLEHGGTTAWLNSKGLQVARQLALMRDRDVDNDGIVESRYRLGISGGHQWSTNWYDVVSFGWKDAFSNALLYRALVLLSKALPRLGRPDLALGLDEWSEQLKASYMQAFFNEETGWLAGWRCKNGLLHDYAFLAVNGAAVCSGVLHPDRAAAIVRNLWDEALRVGLPDPRLGLPGNLWPIPDEDMVELMHGKPMGYYINGGLTHSQSCRFVGALYAVGMTKEGDSLLESLCESLADGSAFGGCNSGVDWRFWDGAPCGYEGILTDQFGILAVAIDRFGFKGGTL